MKESVCVSRVLVKFKIGFRVPGWAVYGPGEIAGFSAKTAERLVTNHAKEGLDGKDCGPPAEYCDADGNYSSEPVTVRVPVKNMRPDDIAA